MIPAVDRDDETGDRTLSDVLNCLADCFFPPDKRSPGGVELGAAAYIERRLRGPRRNDKETIRRGLAVVDDEARRRWDREFVQLPADRRDQLVKSALAGELNDGFATDAVLRKLIDMTIEGVFCDTRHGGNRNEAGWRLLKGMRPPPVPDRPAGERPSVRK